MTVLWSHSLLTRSLLKPMLLAGSLLLAAPLCAATDAAPSVSVSFYKKLNEANDWLQKKHCSSTFPPCWRRTSASCWDRCT